MDEPIWRSGPTTTAPTTPAPTTPAHTPPSTKDPAKPVHGTAAHPTARRVLDALAEGRAGRLFPPVAADVGGYVAERRRLGGRDDAALLAAALAQPRFAPLLAAYADIELWCHTTTDAHPRLFAPGVLALDADALFGPLCTELFTVCAAGRLTDLDGFCRTRVRGRLAHLERFLARLTEDLPVLTARFGVRGRVESLTAHGTETHNHGRVVLRIAWTHGTPLAYKDRPPSGEAMLLDDGEPASVFARINALTRRPDLELPTLGCLRRGTGLDARLWQEWIAPAARVPVHRDHGLTVDGPVVTGRDAPLLWSRAGALTAAAVALGIGDLLEENVFVGRRAGAAPRHHIVDLEVFARPADRLDQTGLTEDGVFHHVGLENRPRLCSPDPPMAYFRDVGGGLELMRLTAPWTRRHTDTVVRDEDRRFGYGPYLPHFLRGAFDLWETLCTHRDELASALRGHAATAVARVLPRNTGDYARMLVGYLLAGDDLPADLTDEERRQLAAGDVPYFFAVPGNEGLHTVDGPVDAPRLTVDAFDPAHLTDPTWDLGALGVFLRDAVAYADTAPPPPAAGVRVGGSEVAVDCLDAGARLVYSWDDTAVRVTVADLGERESPEEVADKLRRIDTVDTVLRDAWVAGERTDAATADRLRDLTEAAIAWLESVVDEHGWPTADLVGAEAADAAVRLLQHADGAIAFRRRCLRELRAAAARGAAAPRDVAYVTDALCVAAGEPQRYGTKFERRDGRLVPYDLADPEGVDAARAAVGLGPLEEYAALLRARFDATITERTNAR